MRRRGFLAGLAASTGGTVSLPLGTVTGAQDYLGVNIYQTSSPVVGGEWLDVFVSVGNGAAYQVTDTLELYDSSGTLLDSQEVTMPRESTDIVGLGYETYETQTDVTFTITVTSSGDADSTTVTVYAVDGTPGFSVSISSTSSPVHAGEWLSVTALVRNETSTQATNTLRLLDSSNDVLDSTEVTLSGGDSQYVQMGYETYPVENTVSFPITVESEGDSDSQDVTVYGTG